MQVRTRMLGGEDYPTQEAVIEKNAELARSGGLERVSNLAWPALLRKLDRVDGSFRD